MSFFTSNAYATFHLPPQMSGGSDVCVAAKSPTASAAAVGRKLSPQKHPNASFSSSTASECDLRSPTHVTRVEVAAADPWNSNGSIFLAMSPASTNVAADVADDVGDSEWGEFMTFSQVNDDELVTPTATPMATGASSISNTRRANRAKRASRDQHEHDGWQRLPQLRSDRESSDGDDIDDVDEASAALAGAASRTASSARRSPQPSRTGSSYANAASAATISPRSGTQETNSSSSSVFDTLAAAMRTRFASLRSDSSNASSPRTPAPPLSTAAAPAAANLPARSYDAYDVPFERGPIGLELETDWYGRQAVVKGFATTPDGGPSLARACGLIRIGDVLTAIDGASCLEMSFQETLAKLRVVSMRRHVLHFQSLEAVGDLSVYTNDLDIQQAKRFIHQHKEQFYRQAPRRIDTAASARPNARNASTTTQRDLILGCVERLRGESVTAFNFHREDTGAFVLACSVVNDGTGAFVFHTLEDSHLRDFRALPQSEDSAVYVGRMVPNFLGTKFTVLDHQTSCRNELGHLVYSANVLGRVPNFLKCVFPRQPVATEDEARENEDDEDEKDESSASQSRPRAATTGSSGSKARDTMMARNGSIAERLKSNKQQRQVSLVERLRHFSFDDLDASLETITSGGSSSSNIDARWHDADDHDSRAARGRSMRLTPRGSSAGGSNRSDNALSPRALATPYGAVDQTEYHCDLLTFETKKPSWNDELGAWTLNFHGRVKMASKKNFLMVVEQGNDAMESEFGDSRVFLRFGKIAPSRFSLDYQAPISPMLALAIVCSSFAHKIAVT